MRSVSLVTFEENALKVRTILKDEYEQLRIIYMTAAPQLEVQDVVKTGCWQTSK